MLQVHKLGSLTFLLSFIICSQSYGKECREIFKEKLGVSFKLKNASVDLSIPIIRESLLPEHTQPDSLYSYQRYHGNQVDNTSLTDIQKVKLAEALPYNQFLFITPIGPSIWTTNSLNTWLKNGDLGLTSSPSHASDFVTRITTNQTKQQLISPFWVRQIQRSALRATKARNTSRENLFRLFKHPNNTKRYIINPANIYRDYKADFAAQNNILAQKENSYIFPFGKNSKNDFLNGRMINPAQMRESDALNVLRVFSNLQLIKNTLYFDGNTYKSIDEASLSTDTLLVMAHYPQLAPLAAHFKEHPIELDMLFPFIVGERHTSFELGMARVTKSSQSYTVHIGIETNDSNQPFTHVKILGDENFRQTKAYKDTIKTLNESITDILNQTRKKNNNTPLNLWSDNFSEQLDALDPINPSDHYSIEPLSNGAYIDFKGLNIAEGHLIYLELVERLGADYLNYSAMVSEYYEES